MAKEKETEYVSSTVLSIENTYRKREMPIGSTGMDFAVRFSGQRDVTEAVTHSRVDRLWMMARFILRT
jgi:hypothetical protein